MIRRLMWYQYLTNFVRTIKLEHLRSEDTPHDYPYYWQFILDPKLKQEKSRSCKFKEFVKSSYFEFWKKKKITRDTPEVAR